ncbi:MAG: hypothetical protein IKP62_08440, partial [Salinivirgaceae bacterium]|nr:hypothetical protein [Salinivirgaceae bacterium]
VLNQSMTVLEQNDYYPFGLRHPNSALKTTANRYRYNGKEEIAADAVVDSLLQISTIDKKNVDKIKVLDSPSTYVRAL